jgi:hypothetical protein
MWYTWGVQEIYIYRILVRKPSEETTLFLEKHCMKMRTGLNWLGVGPIASFYEHGNEPLVSIKTGIS